MSNTDEIANFLFKRALRVGETNFETQFFSEPLPSNVPVYPTQIWADQALIPATAPVLPPNGIDGSGTVQYKEKLLLTAAPSGIAFYSPDLVNTIPFNYDMAGSYNYSLYKNDGVTIIPFGQGDWVLDNASGILTFFSALPPGVSGGAPPKISFYKYVGALGLNASSNTDGNGITITSDGPGGINPVNKANSAITNAYYIRGDNGLVLVNGAEPPGGLSDTMPYGTIYNSPNVTTLLRKIQTINAATVAVVSFPSHVGNQQSYGVKIWTHGTSVAGLASGKVIFKEMRFAACDPDEAILPVEVTVENIQGSALILTKSALSYDFSITGVAGYTIDWIVNIEFTQYRIS